MGASESNAQQNSKRRGGVIRKDYRFAEAPFMNQGLLIKQPCWQLAELSTWGHRNRLCSERHNWIPKNKLLEQRRSQF